MSLLDLKGTHRASNVGRGEEGPTATSNITSNSRNAFSRRMAMAMKNTDCLDKRSALNAHRKKKVRVNELMQLLVFIRARLKRSDTTAKKLAAIHRGKSAGSRVALQW